MPVDDERLRRAAGEHVAAKEIAGHETRRGLAHGLQPLEPERQAGRQFLGWLLAALRGHRHQEPRLEIGEPRRHHQIVGRQFELQAAGALDEGQILLGQRLAIALDKKSHTGFRQLSGQLHRRLIRWSH